MKEWKHLTFEQRKVISSGISHGYKLKTIGENLLVDPTSVSKEVKRNRIEISIGLKSDCKRTQRWPYVCTGCNQRYNNCPYTKYKYDAKKAQKKADTNLINSRRGIDIDAEEFKRLNKIIEDGVNDNKSIYQIKIENNDVIDKCISTLYGYINKGYLTTKRIDLPYAVTCKKRKHNKISGLRRICSHMVITHGLQETGYQPHCLLQKFHIVLPLLNVYLTINP